MKFYNNESMKDLMRPVKWKMWASYIIKHNINVLVESVIVLSGNLNFFLFTKCIQIDVIGHVHA